jgi:hypothetical protein
MKLNGKMIIQYRKAKGELDALVKFMGKRNSLMRDAYAILIAARLQIEASKAGKCWHLGHYKIW